jgi:hypothetical protein
MCLGSYNIIWGRRRGPLTRESRTNRRRKVWEAFLDWVSSHNQSLLRNKSVGLVERMRLKTEKVYILAEVSRLIISLFGFPSPDAKSHINLLIPNVCRNRFPGYQSTLRVVRQPSVLHARHRRYHYHHWPRLKGHEEHEVCGERKKKRHSCAKVKQI